jgi:uncharacterized protein (TIGR03083 family)
VDTEGFLAALRRDGEAFDVAASVVAPETSVPSCPGWTVADLVWHLSGAHGFWTGIVEQRRIETPEFGRRDRPADGDLLDVYRAGLGRLVEVLAAVDPATPVWTWAGTQGAVFVQRRMAHETAVHCWDAQRAGGDPPPVEAMLASDGIDELLSLARPVADTEPIGGTVHLHCTDVPGEWLVIPAEGDERYTVTREHAKGSCALRGPSSDLLLALWRRVPLDRIDVVGDTAVAARFVACATMG